MAISAIAKVIMTLFKKHGISRGASMAQKLGFKNKDIKAAYKQLATPRAPYKKGGTFQQRKGLREAQRDAQELVELDLYNIGGVQAGGAAQGAMSRAEIMRTLLEGGKVSPRVSRAGVRTSAGGRAEVKYSDIGPSKKEWKAMWRKDPNDPRNWQTGQTGPEHPIYGVPGVDFW